MKLLDQARLGKFTVLDIVTQHFTGFRDRATIIKWLDATVPIDIQNVYEWMPEWLKTLPKGCNIFTQDIFPNVRPSFPAMWFEFHGHDWASAVWAIEEDGQWIMSFWDTNGSNNAIVVTHWWLIRPDLTSGNLMFGNIDSTLEGETEQDVKDVILGPSILALLTQDLMHCKNVVLESQPKPPKLTKSFQKKHAKKPATYNVIKIQPMKAIIHNAGGVGNLGFKRAFSLIRGNYATYTAEKQLFGKVTGRFFRRAHHVGDPELGVKKTEYKVKAPKKKGNQWPENN
jgi:hypothetical protein